jgi:NitT/TauT family transport system ATP-binding protein
LSDRVLVMSRRPGTIIDEIAIEIPQRDNPIARRRDARFGDYVTQLMDRLDIAHVALEGALEREAELSK